MPGIQGRKKGRNWTFWLLFLGMNNSCSSISLLAWTPGADEPTEEHSLEELADDVSDGEEEEKTQKIKDFKKIKWYENAADPNLGEAKH